MSEPTTGKGKATTDAGSVFDSSFGVSGAAVASADMQTAASISDAPESGKKIVLDDLFVSTDTEMRLDILEETAGTVILSAYLPASSGFQQITPRGRIKLATAGKKLQAQASAAGNLRITAVYHSEP